VCRVDRSAVDVAADDMTTLLLALDKTIVVRLAHALMIVGIDEQFPISSMRSAMVHDRCFCDDLRVETAFTKWLPR
jgi:hypothetical protein